MKKKIKKTAVCLLVFMAFVMSQGCESITSFTNPDAVKLKTELKWTSGRQPRLRPVSPDKMVVYARFKSTSGADVDVAEAVRRKLEDAGYKITRDISKAHYYLKMDVRYMGEVAVKRQGMTLTGAVLGAGLGAIVGHNSRMGRTGGAIGGAVLGGAVGNIMANRNKIRQISLVIDVSLGERVAGGVKTNLGGRDSRNSGSSTGVATGGGYETGGSNSSTTESQNIVINDDFFYHESKVIVSARKMNLTYQEAESSILSRLSRAIASTMP